MSDYPQTVGKTTIAPDVLLTIARLAALHVDGVERMASVPGKVNKLFKKNFLQNDGVCLELEDDIVYADLYVVLKRDVLVRDVGRAIQVEVQRAIEEMVGMSVGRVNVHVEDIEYLEDL